MIENCDQKDLQALFTKALTEAGRQTRLAIFIDRVEELVREDVELSEQLELLTERQKRVRRLIASLDESISYLSKSSGDC